MPAVSPETRLVVLFDCSASSALESQMQNFCATGGTLGRTSCNPVDDGICSNIVQSEFSVQEVIFTRDVVEGI